MITLRAHLAIVGRWVHVWDGPSQLSHHWVYAAFAPASEKTAFSEVELLRVANSRIVEV